LSVFLEVRILPVNQCLEGDTRKFLWVLVTFNF
jgi:hypothetical protein